MTCLVSGLASYVRYTVANISFSSNSRESIKDFTLEIGFAQIKVFLYLGSSIALSAKLALTLGSVITFRFFVLQWGELSSVDSPRNHYLWVLHTPNSILFVLTLSLQRWFSVFWILALSLILLSLPILHATIVVKPPVYKGPACQLRTGRLKQHMGKLPDDYKAATSMVGAAEWCHHRRLRSDVPEPCSLDVECRG